jgi:hypothetical protein
MMVESNANKGSNMTKLKDFVLSLEKMFFDWYVSLFLGGGKVEEKPKQ